MNDMITDHPYLIATAWGTLVAFAGFYAGIGFRELQVRRLRQANETLRMMLRGAAPFDEARERLNRARHGTASAPKAVQATLSSGNGHESAGWHYKPASRRICKAERFE